jgi:hypothetical protein
VDREHVHLFLIWGIAERDAMRYLTEDLGGRKSAERGAQCGHTDLARGISLRVCGVPMWILLNSSHCVLVIFRNSCGQGQQRELNLSHEMIGWPWLLYDE